MPVATTPRMTTPKTMPATSQRCEGLTESSPLWLLEVCKLLPLLALKIRGPVVVVGGGGGDVSGGGGGT